MQGHHTHGLGVGLRKLVVLTLNIHQISIKMSFILMFNPKASLPIHALHQAHSQLYVQ